MTKLINFLSNNEVMYWLVIAIVVILIVIISVILVNRKKRRDIKKEFDDSLIDLELEKQQDEELESKNFPKELEEILAKMQQNMEAKPEEVVAKFEEEQEKNAVISYQELVKKASDHSIGNIETNIYNATINDENDGIDFVAALDLNDTEEEIIPMFSNNSNEEVIEIEDNIIDEEIEAKQEVSAVNDKKFYENSEVKVNPDEFISPVFGKMENNFDYPTIKQPHRINLHESLTPEEIDVEIERSEAFLKALIDFRNNL